jgi:hypothetical protein
MKLALVKGTTSQTVQVFIQDSSSTTGAGKTGLAFNTASLTAYYARPRAAAAAITLATQTVTGAFSSGGFVEIDATNMPGWYRLDLPDAALATGVDFVGVQLKGAANMAPCNLEIQLTSANFNDAVRAGLSALPNAAAGANGGLPTGNASGQVTVGAYASGQAPLQPTVAARTLDVSATGEAGIDWANIGSPTTAVNLSGTSTKALEPTLSGRTLDINATGEAEADVMSIQHTGVTPDIAGLFPSTLKPGESPSIRTGTASAGGASSITIATGLTGVKGVLVYLVASTGAGQVRVATAYNSGTGVTTVDRAWDTIPDGTTGYSLRVADAPALDSNLAVVAASVTAGVTVTTNNDKTGYGLSAAAVQAVWDALTSALTTVGSIGKRIADFLTGDAYARLGAPAGASVSADVAAVKTDTGTLTGRLTSGRATNLDFLTGDAFARLGAPVGASHSADVAAVKTDTTTLTGRLTSGRATNLDFLTGDAFARLATYRLDQVFLSDVAAPGAGSLAADLTEDNAGTRRFTAAALVNAPAGGGGGGGTKNITVESTEVRQS